MLGASEILALALACAPHVDAGTVLAITTRESTGNPFAIGTGTKATLSAQPTNKDHALQVAAILDNAKVDYDVGLAQINRRNLVKFAYSVEQALDPCTNLQLMQRILLGDYNRAVSQGKAPGAEASLAAISAYNTGSLTAGMKNGYVAKVVRAHPANKRPRAVSSASKQP